jgi:flagellar basal body-associated protein FliL
MEEIKETKTTQQKKKMNEKAIIAGVLVLVLAGTGVGSYFIFFNKSNTTTNRQNNLAGGNFPGGNFPGGQARGANLANINGTISSIADKTAVIDTSDNNGQRIVLLSDTSTITKTVDATKDDILKVDANIVVQGTKSDTTITADKITLTESFNRTPNSTNPSRTPRANNGGNGNNGQPQGTGDGPGGNGGQFGGNNPYGANATIGKITKIDGNTVIIQAFNQTTYTLTISDATKYKKQAQGTVSDIKSGMTVNAIGTADTTGKITARNISIV